MIELFIEEKQERKIALRENGRLQELYIEEENKEARSGDLFLGIIKKKVKALNAIFIDLGLSKNGFLYLTKDAPFDDYKEGQSILVEILKEEEGSKGAKVTDKISIGGKYVVLFPGKGLRFSKKIEKEDFLEKHGNQMPVDGFRILYREASLEASTIEVSTERDELVTKFKDVLRRADTGQGPKKLYGDYSILDRIIRDQFNTVQMIYVDSESLKEYLKEEYGLSSMLFQGETSLFDFYGLDHELYELNRKKVPLKDGGNLVIEETEAMVVIDINSAKFTKGKNKNETALHVNMAAGEEIARQIKLRNLAGIIIIDFIDMDKPKDQVRLYEHVTRCLEKDPLFSKAYPLNELNLMQMTRKKKGHTLRYYLLEECGACKGEGAILAYSYLKNEIRNEFLKKKSHVEINSYHLTISDIYKERITKELEKFLSEVQANDKEIYLEFDSNLESLYTLSPLVFKSQIEEVESFRVNL
ncbi:MAG: hypothetical protein GX829_02985 [Clostridium sp.]|nr:hypothetical protein [Clostridium sp.]